jgi:hypothetical protein
MRIEELKPYVNQARAHLFSFPNVRSVGAGPVWEEGRMTKELGIIVGVEEKLPKAMLTRENIIPRELEGTGIRVDVIRAENPRALPLLHSAAEIPEYDCAWYDTMRSGVGLAHFQVTGGTLGDYRADWNDGTSNNHVVANQNNASPGDPIYQPSPICQVDNRIVAELAAFEPIKFLGEDSQCPWSQSWAAFWNYFMETANRKTRFKALTKLDPFAADAVNHVDVGFIRFKEGILADERIERTEKEWRGYRDEAELGEMLFKSGARTRYTEFPCIQKYVSVSVQYSLGKIAMYENQDVGDNPGGTKVNAGDSGDMDGGLSDIKRTDLTFAGSDTLSILSPYMFVREAHERLIG